MGWGERGRRSLLRPSPLSHEQCEVSRKPSSMLSGPRWWVRKKAGENRTPQGPFPLFNSPLSLPFRDFSFVSHPYSKPLVLPSDTSRPTQEPLKNILTVRARRGGTDPWGVVTFWGIWRPPPAWRRRQRRGEDGGVWERPAGLCPGTPAKAPHTQRRWQSWGLQGGAATTLWLPRWGHRLLPPLLSPKTLELLRPAHSCPGELRLKAHAPAPAEPVCAGSVCGAGPWD